MRPEFNRYPGKICLTAESADPPCRESWWVGLQRKEFVSKAHERELILRRARPDRVALSTLYTV